MSNDYGKLPPDIEEMFRRGKRRETWQVLRVVAVAVAIFVALYFLAQWEEEKRDMEEAATPVMTYPCRLAPPEIREAERAAGNCR